MTIGFNTKKTEAGFEAIIYQIVHNEPMKVLKTAKFQTRAKATGYAKRWTLFFRRGGAV